MCYGNFSAWLDKNFDGLDLPTVGALFKKWQFWRSLDSGSPVGNKINPITTISVFGSCAQFPRPVDRRRRRRGVVKGPRPPQIFGTTKTSAFSTNAQSRIASVVLDGVLGPLRLARHT